MALMDIKFQPRQHGELEIYAWKEATLSPYTTKTGSIAPNVTSERLELPAIMAEDAFVKVWVNIGPNRGYRFPGGALVYSETNLDVVCTYGGLVYGYSSSTSAVRLWRPAGTINDGVICISNIFSRGINAQRDLEASVIINVWATKEASNGIYFFVFNLNVI